MDEQYRTTPDPQTGIAPCCTDPRNRRTSTIDPARVAAAKGGVPGVQVCSVCGRRHYTFAPDPIGTVR